MTPTQDFENYPEFANSGKKSQPNDAKYSAGFIPSDVLPAEWLNWFLNGATKGVTALNTGVKSVEQEINSVLKSRSVTPDINAAGQLLAVLNKIKAEAINEAWPVGITYVQYPQQKSPQELFPKTTWEVVSYEGAFFRAEGGNANAFIEKSDVLSVQGDTIKAHTHQTSCKGMSGNATGTLSVVATYRNGATGSGCISLRDAFMNGDFGGAGGKGGYFYTMSINVSHTHNVIVDNYGDNETRPENFTVRIWKRTA